VTAATTEGTEAKAKRNNGLEQITDKNNNKNCAYFRGSQLISHIKVSKVAKINLQKITKQSNV